MPSALEIVSAVAPCAAPLGIAVPLRLPSAFVVARYVVDPDEHRRRAATSPGAVVAPSDLADLWELPAGMQLPRSVLQAEAAESLSARGLITRFPNGSIQREFEPCGSVTALYAVDQRPDAALRRASLLSPIYERYAVVSGHVSRLERTRVASLAERCGVGVMLAEGESAFLVPAPRPRLGCPHVFRWWMSEMAYASWLTIRAEPTS